MFGSPKGVMYPQRVWRGSELVYIDSHGCIIGEQRWCERRGRCIGVKDACLMYAPGTDLAVPTAIRDLAPREIEKLNISKAQVRMRRDMAKSAPLKVSDGNPLYQVEGKGQLATIEPNQQEVPRINMTVGEADQRIIFRVTSDAFYDKVHGVGQQAYVEPPAHHHINTFSPMYEPSVIDRKTSDAEYIQVEGVGQFARIQSPPSGRRIVNAIQDGVFTPGQGAVANVNARPVKQVHSPATHPAYISPLITKESTVPIFAPENESVPVGEREYFYSPGTGPMKRK